jgi:hypothetical protein
MAEQIRAGSSSIPWQASQCLPANIPDPALGATVVRPASLGDLFLIDLLLLADAANRAAKPDADIERHRSASWRSPADAYTPDEVTLLLTRNALQGQDLLTFESP